MHAVVRSYSGSGAKELFDRLEESKESIENLLRSIAGFVSYSLVRTDDGGFSVTVCEEKSGTDESMKVTWDWVQKNASDLKVNPPSVMEGSVIIQSQNKLAAAVND